MFSCRLFWPSWTNVSEIKDTPEIDRNRSIQRSQSAEDRMTLSFQTKPVCSSESSPALLAIQNSCPRPVPGALSFAENGNSQQTLTQWIRAIASSQEFLGKAQWTETTRSKPWLWVYLALWTSAYALHYEATLYPCWCPPGSGRPKAYVICWWFLRTRACHGACAEKGLQVFFASWVHGRSRHGPGIELRSLPLPSRHHVTELYPQVSCTPSSILSLIFPFTIFNIG